MLLICSINNTPVSSTNNGQFLLSADAFSVRIYSAIATIDTNNIEAFIKMVGPRGRETISDFLHAALAGQFKHIFQIWKNPCRS